MRIRSRGLVLQRRNRTQEVELVTERTEATQPASAVPKMRVNGRGEDVIFFDGVFFKPSLKSIFFVS